MWDVVLFTTEGIEGLRLLEMLDHSEIGDNILWFFN